jgi:competence protein ComEC
VTDLRLAMPTLIAWIVLVVVLGLPTGLREGTLPAVTWISVAAGVGALAVGLAFQGYSKRRVHPGARAPHHARTGTAAEVCALVSVTLALTGAVTGVAAATLTTRSPTALMAASDRGAPVELQGTVTATADQEAGQLRLLATSAQVHASGFRLNSPMLVTDAEFGEIVPGLGDSVVVRATLVPVEGGGSLAFFARAKSPVTIAARATGVVQWAEQLRSGLRQTANGLPGDGAALLPGVSIGDTSRVDEGLDRAMKASGLSHLTAVSGANCAVVVGLVLLAGGLVGLRRWMRIVSSLLVLAAFVVLVTPEPSVQRAAVMAGLALGLQWVGRPVKGLPLIAVAVTVLLLGDPWLARDYAFALSVLATTGLVVLTKPLTALLSRVIPEPLALVLAVPLVAQLSCQPLLLTLEPSLPVHGLLANVLAGPAAPVATVLGLGACLLGPFWPWAAPAVAAAAWAPASWIAAVAHFSSDLPGARLSWSGAPWAVVLAGLIVALVGAVLLTTPFRRSRRIAVAALVVCLLPVTSVLAGREVGSRLSQPGLWQFAQCDVGQGDAVLVKSNEHIALVDTGDDEALLRECLDRFGVEEIDLLVLTHFDRDHVGAAALLVGRAEKLLVGLRGSTTDSHLVDTFAGSGTEIIEAVPDEVLPLGDLQVTVLWPPERSTAGNPASVVLSVVPAPGCAGSCLSAVMLGDLGEKEQQRLEGRTSLEPVDIVKVSHHGSKDQSARLYEALRPQVALIGVGAKNSYGHPTEKTLALLARIGARVVRSDLAGTSALSSTPSGIDVWEQGQRVSAAAPRLDPGRLSRSAAGGGTWLRRRPPRSPLSRSTRSRGTGSARPASSSCRARSSSSPIVPSGSSATSWSPKILGSK